MELCLTDQSAAFYVLDSNILQVKLDPLDFSPTACKLIKDYLSGRQNKVLSLDTCTQSQTSDWCRRGLSLGPFLHSVEYADDCAGDMRQHDEEPRKKFINICF